MQSRVCIFEHNGSEQHQSAPVRLLRSELENKGYRVYIGPKEKQVVTDVKRLIPDFCIIDITLPDLDGQLLCKELRRLFPYLPFFILTHQEGPSAQRSARALGAQHYLTKPFLSQDINKQLLLWHQAIKEFHSDFAHLDIKANRENRDVIIGHQRQGFSKTLHKLLLFFLEHLNFTLTREMILEHVWQSEIVKGTRVVDVYIGYLRDKLHDPQGKILKTKQGEGYSLQLFPDPDPTTGLGKNSRKPGRPLSKSQKN